jgi:hypothetical protein
MTKPGGALEITLHAIQRYQQRVENVPAAIVVERLCGPAFECAMRMGKASVILPQGNRAVIQDGAIVTVLPLPSHIHRRRK